MDLKEFSRRVRRDDYARHKYWLVGVVAGILGLMASENGYFLLLSGVSLIGSAIAVIRAGQGDLTATAVDWSTSELAEMSPEERVDDANSTGGCLLMLGVAFLALVAYGAWRQLRDYWGGREFQAMADAAGLVSRVEPTGTGLAAGSREVCWSDGQTVVVCSDPDLVEIELLRTHSAAHELVVTPRGLVLASDRDVSWLPSSITHAEFAGPPRRIFGAGAKSLSALGARVAWVSNTDVVVANLGSERPLESARVVAQVAMTDPPLLALAPDAVLYGPTESCTLEWQDAKGCAVPPRLRPCAVGSSEKQLALLTDRGELWRATARAKFTLVAAGLRGCLLAVNEHSAFVAGEGPIVRVDLGSGHQATIFQDEPVGAIALSDRTLYFRSASEVKGIRIDAPPL